MIWIEYLIGSWRALRANYGFAAIGIAGLSIGFCACILIIANVRFEFSFDRWVPQHERILRLEATTASPGRAPRQSQSAPFAIYPHLGEKLADVSAAARAMGGVIAASSSGNTLELPVTYVDPAFLDIFPVETLSGDAKRGLQDASSIVLTREQAIRLFGTVDAAGRTLTANAVQDLRVAAVVEDWPANSHLTVHALAPISSPTVADRERWLTDWGSLGGAIYLRFANDVDGAAIAEAINGWLPNVAPANYGRDDPTHGIPRFYTFSLRPLADLHLYGTGPGLSGARVNPMLLVALTITALLILAVAGLNFASLATSQVLRRNHEIAVRRILGAERRELFWQFELEAVLCALVACMVGYAAAWLVAPTYAQLVGDSGNTGWFGLQLFGISVLLALMAGLLAGLHPALTAAAQPANLSQMARSANLRGMKALHVLMAVQFAVAIGIAFFALVSYRQAAFGRSETALFDDPNVAIVWSLDKPGVASRARAYREAVGRLPGVLAIAETGIAPGDGNKFSVSVRRGAVDTAATAELMNVGDNLFGLLGIRPLAGRVFSAERTSDHFPQDAESAVPVVINLTAVHQLGFESSEAAIGQSFQQTYGKGRTWRSATIIGVVPDFHFRSPFSKVEQTVFVSDPDSASRLLVKFADTQTNTLAQLSGQWDQMFPALPFDGEMLAEALARQYQSVRSSATLMALGTCLALLTAALGTFGLAAVAIGRYTREVAIRRILGAERRDIFRYFGLQFTLPVLAGSVIACPIAFYFAHRWLQSFDQRITLSPALFVVATLVALVLAWLAVSVHVIRVCNIRAAAALRTD